MTMQDESKPFTAQISTESAPQTIACTATITNSGEKDYYLLCRHTPLEGLLSDIFCVSTGAGDMIPYKGIQLKRGPPSDDEYILIKAKSSKTKTVNLSRAYRMNSPGTYSVQLKMSLKFCEDKLGTNLTQKVHSDIAVAKQTGEVTESRKEQAGTRKTPSYKLRPPGPKSPPLAVH